MKTVLLGMNNPLSDNLRHALFPYPVGSTGWRIWQLLRIKDETITRGQYLEGFDRVDLVLGLEWSNDLALQRASRLPSLYAGRTIVVFGDACRRAIGLPKMLIHPVELHGVTWRQLPHPSGRCLWYNDIESKNLAASLLHELFLKGMTDGE